MITEPQRRLLCEIKAHDFPEYWPVLNEWVEYDGPGGSLAFFNAERTVGILKERGYLTITEDGLFELTEKGLRNL